MGKTITQLELIQKVRRPVNKPGKYYCDKSKYTRKQKHRPTPPLTGSHAS